MITACVDLKFFTIGLVVVLKSYTNFYHYQVSTFEINLFELMWSAAPLVFLLYGVFVLKYFLVLSQLRLYWLQRRVMKISNIKYKNLIKTNLAGKLTTVKNQRRYILTFFCPTSSLNNFLIVWAIIINFMSVERSIP